MKWIENKCETAPTDRTAVLITIGAPWIFGDYARGRNVGPETGRTWGGGVADGRKRKRARGTYFLVFEAEQQHFFHQREPRLLRVAVVDVLVVVERVGRLTAVLAGHAVGGVVPVRVAPLHQTVGATHHRPGERDA